MFFLDRIAIKINISFDLGYLLPNSATLRKISVVMFKKIAHAIKSHHGKATQAQIRQFIKSNFPNYSDTQLKKLVSSALWHYKRTVFPRERELINGKFETSYRVDSVEWKKDGVRKKGENEKKERNQKIKDSQKKKGGNNKEKQILEIENESDDSEEIDEETEKNLQEELEKDDEIDIDILEELSQWEKITYKL